MRLQDHPTVRWFSEHSGHAGTLSRPGTIEAKWLTDLCMEAGADDAGLVEIDRPALATQKKELLELMPGARTIVSVAFCLNKAVMRSVAHSLVSLEFRQAWDHANRTARRIAADLREQGIPAVNAPVGFPYEADRWPGKTWLTSDKLVAVEAGIGRMGWNRLVLHPRFGGLVILGTILAGSEASAYSRPLDYNPCIQCKLCVSVCPTGAICADGHFNFVSCYTHNYRERLGGFVNWIEQLVAATGTKDYRKKVSDAETISMWQNLSICPQTRCDRCVAVCPAGQENIADFLTDRKGYVEQVVKGFNEKRETIYVIAGSDAEEHLAANLPHKTVKRVSNGLHLNSAAGFLRALPIVFQRSPSMGLDATFHFTFTGDEVCKGTVVIRDQTVTVHEDHIGVPDLLVTADSRTWVEFLAGEKNLIWAMMRRRVRTKGSLKLMRAFAKCFPS